MHLTPRPSLRTCLVWVGVYEWVWIGWIGCFWMLSSSLFQPLTEYAWISFLLPFGTLFLYGILYVHRRDLVPSLCLSLFLCVIDVFVWVLFSVTLRWFFLLWGYGCVFCTVWIAWILTYQSEIHLESPWMWAGGWTCMSLLQIAIGCAWGHWSPLVTLVVFVWTLAWQWIVLFLIRHMKNIQLSSSWLFGPELHLGCIDACCCCCGGGEDCLGNE